MKQLKASLEQASASGEKAKAQLSLSQLTYDRQHQLLEAKVIAQAALDTAQRNLEAARQAVAEAEAAEQRARLSFSSEIGGIHTTVARLSADLRDAQYDLDQTTVVAPTDGFVTQLFLRPGMVAASSPAMIFIHNDRVFSAAFPQAVVQRLRLGAEAEVVFDAIPGRIFQAKVVALSDAVSQGQLQASGTLVNPEDRAMSPGLVLVNIVVTDDLLPYQLPGGRPRKWRSTVTIGVPSPQSAVSCCG